MKRSPSSHIKQLRHERIAELLRSRILQDLNPGEKLPTIAVLAKQFEVSEITLRNALLSLQQEGLIDIQHGRGSFVTRPRRRERSVGLLTAWDLSHPRMSPFYFQLMQALTEFFAAHGRSTRKYIGQFSPPDASEQLVELVPSCPEFITDLTRDRLDGLVLLATPMPPEWEPRLAKNNIPAVGLGFKNIGNWGETPCVELDYSDMVGQAMRCLAQQGRRRVACIGWGNSNDKFEGETGLPDLCRQACESIGLETRDRWIRMDVHPGIPGAGWQCLREAWSAYHDKPDALLVLDDTLLYEAATAVMELGIQVPRQLLIATHANDRVPLAFPFPLIKMQFTMDDIAQAIGRTMIDALNDPAARVKPSTVTCSVTTSPGLAVVDRARNA